MRAPARLIQIYSIALKTMRAPNRREMDETFQIDAGR
jgi:hypothetical protein